MRIQLTDVDPVVWRRVLDPGPVRLSKLSQMLLAAMGQTNSHLHSFRVGDKQFGMHVDDWPEGEIDEKDVTVLQALREERRFLFDYDFGDSGEHEVVIEELSWSDYGLKFAVCIDGQSACPSEDVGGTPCYANFLEAIDDPDHEQRDGYLEWAAGSFDPTEFHLGAANAACKKVR